MVNINEIVSYNPCKNKAILIFLLQAISTKEKIKFIKYLYYKWYVFLLMEACESLWSLNVLSRSVKMMEYRIMHEVAWFFYHHHILVRSTADKWSRLPSIIAQGKSCLLLVNIDFIQSYEYMAYLNVGCLWLTQFWAILPIIKRGINELNDMFVILPHRHPVVLSISI